MMIDDLLMVISTVEFDHIEEETRGITSSRTARIVIITLRPPMLAPTIVPVTSIPVFPRKLSLIHVPAFYIILEINVGMTKFHRQKTWLPFLVLYRYCSSIVSKSTSVNLQLQTYGMYRPTDHWQGTCWCTLHESQCSWQYKQYIYSCLAL